MNKLPKTQAWQKAQTAAHEWENSVSYHISELIKPAASPLTDETKIKAAKPALKDTDPLCTRLSASSRELATLPFERNAPLQTHLTYDHFVSWFKRNFIGNLSFPGIKTSISKMPWSCKRVKPGVILRSFTRSEISICISSSCVTVFLLHLPGTTIFTSETQLFMQGRT